MGILQTSSTHFLLPPKRQKFLRKPGFQERGQDPQQQVGPNWAVVERHLVAGGSSASRPRQGESHLAGAGRPQPSVNRGGTENAR